MEREIKGFKVIEQGRGEFKSPDDPSMPWRLDLVKFPGPEWLMCGLDVAGLRLPEWNEVIRIRAESKDVLEDLILANRWRNNRCVVSLDISQPEKGT